MDPYLSQDLHLGKGPQPARRVGRPQGGRHLLPVPSEVLRSRDHGLRPTGHLPDLDPAPVPLVPLGLDLRPQPLRRDLGQFLQSSPQTLSGQLQAAETSHRGQHIRRVGTLPPAGLQKPCFGQPREHHLQHPVRRVTFDQAGAEVAQERSITRPSAICCPPPPHAAQAWSSAGTGRPRGSFTVSTKVGWPRTGRLLLPGDPLCPRRPLRRC